MKFNAQVTEILYSPKYYRFENVEWWEVTVEYDLYGMYSTITLRFKTREEVEAIQVGTTIEV